jgi:cell division protein FtsX
LLRKLFGFEAEIGLKNLKRNKRRYQATVISLIISIVLFLSVSYFTDNLRKSAELSQDGVNFDIQIQLPGENLAQDKHLIEISLWITFNLNDFLILNAQQQTTTTLVHSSAVGLNSPCLVACCSSHFF